METNVENNPDRDGINAIGGDGGISEKYCAVSLFAVMCARDSDNK
jgi:hypothetical protein